MIPPPSTSSHVTKHIEDPSYKDQINPEFIKQIEKVRTKIFEKCEPKRGYTTGSLVNGIRKCTVSIYNQRYSQGFLETPFKIKERKYTTVTKNYIIVSTNIIIVI